MFKFIVSKRSGVYNYFFPTTTQPIEADEHSSIPTADSSSARSIIPTSLNSTTWQLPSWLSMLMSHHSSEFTSLGASSNIADELLLTLPEADPEEPSTRFSLPREIPTSQADIRWLLQTPSLFQRVINEGQLSIIPLPQFTPHGSPPVFIATFFGVSALSRFITQADGSQALQVGSFVIPLEFTQQPQRLAIEELKDDEEAPPSPEEIPTTYLPTDDTAPETNTSAMRRFVGYMASWLPTWPFSSSKDTSVEELDEENNDEEQDSDSELFYSDDESIETPQNLQKDDLPEDNEALDKATLLDEQTTLSQDTTHSDPETEDDEEPYEEASEADAAPSQTNTSTAQRLTKYVASWLPRWPFPSSQDTLSEDLDEANNEEQDFDSELADSGAPAANLDMLDEEPPLIDEQTETNTGFFAGLMNMLKRARTDTYNYFNPPTTTQPETSSERDAEPDSVFDNEEERPREFPTQQEEILQYLKNPLLLKQFLNDGSLIITPRPATDSTEHPLTYQINLFGHTTTGTVVTQANGEQVLQLHGIEIPFSSIYSAQREPEDGSDNTETAIDDIAPSTQPADNDVGNENEEEEEEDDAFDLFDEETEPPAFEDSQAHLERNIQKIRDPDIQRRARDVQRKLELLQQRGKEPEKVAMYLHMTNQLLTSKPGAERQAIASKYKQLAAQAQTSHSPAMQALGIAMVLLAIVVTAVSAISIPITSLAGGAAVAGGVALFAAGIGLFAHGRPRRDDANKLMANLCSRIDEDDTNLLTNEIGLPQART